MMPQESFGYDRAITIFAPDGRLYQVEYANEAVRRGTPAIGVKSPDGVVLVVQRRLSSKLEDSRFVHKIFKVDDHIGVAISGLHADARRLIDYARVVAQWNRLNFGEPILIAALTKQIGDLEQYYTQHAFARPFGVAMLIGGVDDAPRLYSTGASGSYWGWRATAIGSGAEDAQAFLEKNYKKDLSLDDAIILAIKALRVAYKDKLNPDLMEISVIGTQDKEYKTLEPNEIKKYYTSAKVEEKSSKE